MANQVRQFVYSALICLILLSLSFEAGGAEPSATKQAPPQAPSGLSCEFLRSPNSTVIFDPEPEFAWICGSGASAYTQGAYQVQVQRAGVPMTETPLWDSGQVASDYSVNVEYAGPPLEPNGRYAWRVKTWDSRGVASPWSELQEFQLASKPTSKETSKYNVTQSEVQAEQLEENAEGQYFADFGKDAFGFLKLHWPDPVEKAFTLEVRFGEKLLNGKIDQNPGGSIRHYSVQLAVEKGATETVVRPPRNKRNTSGAAVLLPPEIGIIAPFRYVELSGVPGRLTAEQLTQVRVEYPFDETASSFESSDETLNQVWELCKYSIRATSFCGVYVDGDRERIPYEADAYINQLSHYCVDHEYAMARYSHEYLLQHPTWPTEWYQHSILMAREDYMYTGNTESLEICYDQLKREKLLSAAMNSDGLLDTSGGNYRDIVDWPLGERDSHEMLPVNIVVNAFHYATLVRMAKIAEALGRSEDARQFADEAQAFKERFNKVFWDEAQQRYIDGQGSQHASVHANLFPLAFDLVPSDRVAPVTDFLEERGMRCSVYAAQYLLDGLYRSDRSELGLKLLTSKSRRSWYNMIRIGSTITLEAWDRPYKPNLDWNHAWGAAPANVIPRYVVGVRPLEPGFKRFIVQPQPASLQSFSAKVPTIRGPVFVDYSASQTGYELKVTVPGNSTARVALPSIENKPLVHVLHNGKPIEVRSEGQHLWIDDVQPGTHVFHVAISDAELVRTQVSE